MSAQVLLFGLCGEKEKKIKLIALRARVRVFSVPTASLRLPVGALSAGTAQGGRNETPLPGEMLLFCGMADGALSAFLASLRAEEAQVPLKAVLTAENAGWDAFALYAALSEERKKLGG